ncbi:MAG: 23S rRNA (uracil(1939)-C(5))-methyltransferase RlmD [Christensenellales bacterium]
MQKNDVLTLEVEGFGAEAEGLCRHEGQVVFVPGALAGERIEAVVVKAAKNHAYGRLLRLIRGSPHRVQPPCPYYPRCGGCSCQHMDYATELDFKRTCISDALQRIGGLSIQVPPVQGMSDPWHYRNKASLPLTLSEGQPLSGFYMRRSHHVIPTAACLISRPQSDLASRIVTGWMARFGVSLYDEVAHSGLVRHIMTRVSRTGQVMVVLIINGESLPHQDDLIGALRLGLPGLVSLCISVNTQRGNTILGAGYSVLWGEERLRDSLCGFSYLLSPLSFFQVNPEQAERLYRCALALAEPRPDDLVIDLYCGAGTISSLFAARAREVIGIELVAQAVEDAHMNARLNGIQNLRFMQGAAERLMPQLAAQGSRPDIIVLDPPRKGAEEAVLQAVCQAAPRRIIYVSCHPGTQARDARYLCEHGYLVTACQPFDMFCHTAEVENVLRFDRKEGA